jgi:branched-chain amino acid transport system permease protein
MLSRLNRHSWVIPAVAAVVVAFLPNMGLSVYWSTQLILIAIYALIVSGLNLSFGYAGELALGQVAFFAAGAYVAAILRVRADNPELLIAIALAMVLAGVMGLVVALPALRLGGWPLALTSFFVVLLIPDVLLVLEGLTNGRRGIIGVFGLEFLGTKVDRDHFYILTIALTALWLFALRNLVTSRYGMALQLLKQSPQLASSLAVNVPMLRFSAYGIGALPAGLAGVLFAYNIGVVDPTSFSLQIVVSLFAASIVGGARSIWGAPVGAFILVAGPMQAQSFASYSTIVYGVFLIAVGVFIPGGLAGVGSRLWTRVAGRAALEMSLREMPASATSIVFPGKELAVRDVHKEFGGLKALDGAELTAGAGKVTALIGPNGAGKTTLLNAIGGFINVRQGSIRLGDDDLTGRSTAAIARQGVARTFQTPRIPHGFTVLDVVVSGRLRVGRLGIIPALLRLPSFRRQRRADIQAALEVLRFAGLEHLAAADAQSLPLGTRRLLEVARALAGAPGVVLLDEPAAGLDEAGLEGLQKLISRARDAGATIVLVEHNVPFVMGVADSVWVMNLGKPLVNGTPEEIRNNSAVLDVYLGRGGEPLETAAKGIAADKPLEPAELAPSTLEAEPLLVAEGVSVGYGDLTVVRNVSVEVSAGRTTALFGRNGAGKTTLLAGLSGLLPAGTGTIYFDGREVTSLKPWVRAAQGIALVQEGKRVFRGLTVQENLVLALPRGLTRAARAERIDQVYDRFPILRQKRNHRAGSLSGGQQQMLALGSAMAAGPRVLLIDEPSSGLAPVVVQELLRAVSRFKEEGVAVLLVEQLVEEVLNGHADQVVVLEGGKLVHSSDAMSTSVDDISAAYVG